MQGRGREVAGELVARRAVCLNWACTDPRGPGVGNHPGLPDTPTSIEAPRMRVPRGHFTARRAMFIVALVALNLATAIVTSRYYPLPRFIAVGAGNDRAFF